MASYTVNVYSPGGEGAAHSPAVPEEPAWEGQEKASLSLTKLEWEPVPRTHHVPDRTSGPHVLEALFLITGHTYVLSFPSNQMLLQSRCRREGHQEIDDRVVPRPDWKAVRLQSLREWKEATHLRIWVSPAEKFRGWQSISYCLKVITGGGQSISSKPGFPSCCTKYRCTFSRIFSNKSKGMINQIKDLNNCVISYKHIIHFQV